VAEIERLIRLPDEQRAELIVVGNEVGLGLVPSTPLGRAFRDLSGLANQLLAAAADEVVMLVAGLPLRLKG
jgi:adenosylcobinamide kinase/adenosylcobinamide-phosphate guanylyltransferase